MNFKQAGTSELAFVVCFFVIIVAACLFVS